MAEKENIVIRRIPRHSYTSIRLRVKIGQDWMWINAMDWNESGFNFSLNHEFKESNLLFKEWMSQFSADVMWRNANFDTAFYAEALLNGLIFNLLEKSSKNEISFDDLFKLIRSRGNMSEKMSMLNSLGVEMSEEKLKSMLDQHELTILKYRYGVKVDSEEWVKIVKSTLQRTSKAEELSQLLERLRNPS